MLGLGTSQILDPGAALPIRQGADPINGQTDGRGVQAKNLGLSRRSGHGDQGQSPQGGEGSGKNRTHERTPNILETLLHNET
jgi:hypothetical protein